MSSGCVGVPYEPVLPPGYVPPLADWPEARTAVPARQCAVRGCVEDKSIEMRPAMGGPREVMRRWCRKHALFYDVECTRRGTPAPVFDIVTGERVG